MRLIDADALAEKKFQERECIGLGDGPAYREGWNDAFDAVMDNEPSAQPEIIRCRECKWWDRCPSSTIAPLYHLCRRVGRMNMTADDFCSRAEQWEVSE